MHCQTERKYYTCTACNPTANPIVSVVITTGQNFISRGYKINYSDRLVSTVFMQSVDASSIFSRKSLTCLHFDCRQWWFKVKHSGGIEYKNMNVFFLLVYSLLFRTEKFKKFELNFLNFKVQEITWMDGWMQERMNGQMDRTRKILYWSLYEPVGRESLVDD